MIGYSRGSGYASTSMRPWQVVCYGNSLTAVSASWTCYPTQMAPLVSPVPVHNLGTGGATTQQLISWFNSQPLPLIGPQRRISAVIWEATNSIVHGGSTGDEAMTLTKTLCDLFRSNAERIVVLDVIARSPSEMTPTMEGYRQTYNTRLSAEYRGFADALVKVSETFDDCTDETVFYTDHIHLNTTGCGIVAGLVKAALFG